MATPLVAGLTIAATALAARHSLQLYQVWRSTPRLRRVFEGGFQSVMDRREAANILGIRETASSKAVREAHRRVMIANHPDSGGSDYLATKINEAKEVMSASGGRSTSSSAF